MHIKHQITSSEASTRYGGMVSIMKACLFLQLYRINRDTVQPKKGIQLLTIPASFRDATKPTFEKPYNIQPRSIFYAFLYTSSIHFYFAHSKGTPQ